MLLAHSSLRRLFAKSGGILRTKEILAAKVHPRDLYELQRNGVIERLGRDVFRWSDLPAPDDLVVVSRRVPLAVICLISALAQHGLTTQIPHAVHIALPSGARIPVMDHPPIDVHRFFPSIYGAGIETFPDVLTEIKVYGPEKTLADCFRFRNKIGMDVFLEALVDFRTFFLLK